LLITLLSIEPQQIRKNRLLDKKSS
jgi:hypothetical protein